MDRNLITEAEAAEYLSVSRNFLAERRCHGNGPPFVRLGRAIRYSKAALDRWVDTNTVDTIGVSPESPPFG
jgi:excisionase family DNA binding protein